MKKNKRISAVLLLMLCGFLAACGGEELPDTQYTEPAESEETLRELVIDGSYQIVRSDFSAGGEVNVRAAVDLMTMLKEETGVKFTLTTDWFRKETEIPPKEILVGENNRPESTEIYDSLGSFEWCVAARNEKIVIAARTKIAYGKALEYFMETFVNGKDEIRVPENFCHRETLEAGEQLITIDWENQAEEIRVDGAVSYPRLYQLRDGTLLCGIDGWCFRSEDDGTTWSKAYDYRCNYHVTGKDGRDYALVCANSAFFELEDGTILAAYRATGHIAPGESEFCTKILVSQSSDGGRTWSAHSTMCEYYDNEGQFKGVWEPHFGLLNGVLTCFYANDSRTVIAPPYQNIEYLQWIDGEWTNRTIVADGVKHKSRDGMPVWMQLSDGGYVCAIEGWYPGTSELCIQLIYSPDGITWGDPRLIYRSPDGYAGAPYIQELPNGQFLVTFQQTSNNCYSILSDGTPANELTSGNFSEPVCLFNSDPKYVSSWNCIYMTDGYLYVGTGTNRAVGTPGTILKRASLKDLMLTGD